MITQIQIKQINLADLSGFIGQVAATGVVLRHEETGALVDRTTLNHTGDILWYRDLSLSGLLGLSSGDMYHRIHISGKHMLALSGLAFNTIDSLSGNLVATGGVFNETGLDLWVRDVGLSDGMVLLSGRDTNLSNNIAALSGGVVFSFETGEFLTTADSGNLAGGVGDLTHESGTLLFNRDTELSNNLANISGTIPVVEVTQTMFDDLSGNLESTGIFLEQTGYDLFVRDRGLSDNIVALSGMVGGGDLTHESGTLLFDRDTELSDNVATISGNTVFTSDTGLFLTQADSGNIDGDLTHESGTLLFDRDTELSDNVATLSGVMVTTSETGGFLDLADQTALEGRDDEVGNNLATLSGAVVFSSETGGYLDLSHQTSLEARDDELGSNLATLSGAVVFSSDTGDFLDPTDVTALEDRDTELSDNVATLSGLVVFDSETGFLATKDEVSAASAGVSSINSESGVLTFIGVGGVSITTLNDTFSFSGQQSWIESLSGNLVSSGATFNQTGLDLWVRENGLSLSIADLSGVTVFKSTTGGLLDLADKTNLEARDDELSSNIALVSGAAVLDLETGNLLDTADRTDLENRDTELSNNVATLSGSVVFVADTGDLLDLSDLTVLDQQDIELSNNIAQLSGQTTFNSETGGLLDLSNLSDLESSDTELSANVATLSGEVAFSSETGDFLDPTDYLLLFNRDTELSDNVAILSGSIGGGDVTQDELLSLSGNVVASGGTFNTSGLDLFNRDLELSDNIASLSGNVVTPAETGGLLDLEDQTDLETRDTELSNNVNTLSGNVTFNSETGGLLDLKDLSDLETRDTLLSDNVATLSGNVVFTSETGGYLDHKSGTLLFDRDKGLSDNMATLSGQIGGGDVSQDELASLSGNVVASGGTFNTSGLNLWNRDLQLSNNVSSLSGAIVFSSETGGYLDHKSGTLLFDRDTELSDNVADISGLMGDANQETIDSLSGNVVASGGVFNTSGLNLWNRDKGLSDNISTLSGNVTFNSETGGLLDLKDLSNLEARDTELSNNVATLSGNIVFSNETGGYLDHKSGTLLFDRDSELSSNAASISGNVDTNTSDISTQTSRVNVLSSNAALISGYARDRDIALSDNVVDLSGDVSTNTSNIGTNNTNSINRDGELSNNIAALSGVTTFDSATGGLLDLTDKADLEGRDTELSDNLALVSGQGGWETDSGVLLWDRDIALSDNVVDLSGDVSSNTSEVSTQTSRINVLSYNVSLISGQTVENSETGGFLDLTDKTALEDRDTELSDNLASVSGLIGGGDVTQAMVDSLSGNLVASGAVFNESGLDLWNRDIGLSANIVDLSGDVSSNASNISTQGSQITELSSNVALVSGQSVENSETGGFLDLADQTTLENRDDELSSNVATLSGNIVFNSETGGYLDLADETALELRDTNLSSNVASISGNVTTNASNITLQTNRITSLTGSLNNTGSTLFTRGLGLSDNLALVSGQVGDPPNQVIDHWTTSEAITSDYNNRYIILSHGIPQTGTLPNGLDAGFSAYFLNVNDGDWVFTGEDLRDLYDNSLTGYVIYRGEIANFTLESGNYWRAIGDDKNSTTGGLLDHASGTLLFDRDTELSDNLADVSGLIGGWDHASGTLLWDRDLSLTGSMDETGLALWNRELELSNNLATVSGQGGTDSDAIHDNVGGEINAISEKGTPASSDWLLIEDSADSNSKKKVQITNLPAGASTEIGDRTVYNALTDGGLNADWTDEQTQGTDDAAPAETWIEAGLSSSKRRFYFPKGSYRWNKDEILLNNANDIEIFGDGIGQTIFHIPGWQDMDQDYTFFRFGTDTDPCLRPVFRDIEFRVGWHCGEGFDDNALHGWRIYPQTWEASKKVEDGQALVSTDGSWIIRYKGDGDTDSSEPSWSAGSPSTENGISITVTALTTRVDSTTYSTNDFLEYTGGEIIFVSSGGQVAGSEPTIPGCDDNGNYDFNCVSFGRATNFGELHHCRFKGLIGFSNAGGKGAEIGNYQYGDEDFMEYRVGRAYHRVYSCRFEEFQYGTGIVANVNAVWYDNNLFNRCGGWGTKVGGFTAHCIYGQQGATIINACRFIEQYAGVCAKVHLNVDNRDGVGTLITNSEFRDYGWLGVQAVASGSNFTKTHPDFDGYLDSGVITATQSTTTVTSSAAIFLDDHIGWTIEWDTGETAKIISITSTTIVETDASQTVGSDEFKIYNLYLSHPTKAISVVNCHFRETLSANNGAFAAIGDQLGSCGVTVQGCTFMDTVAFYENIDGALIYPGSSASGIQFIGNYCGQTWRTTRCYVGTGQIIGNVFDYRGEERSPTVALIYLRDYAQFKDNTVWIKGQSDIDAANAVIDINGDGVVIEGNYIVANDRAELLIRGQGDNANVVIRNNVLNPGPSGRIFYINKTSTSRWVWEGNRAEGTTSEDYLRGIDSDRWIWKNNSGPWFQNRKDESERSGTSIVMTTYNSGTGLNERKTGSDQRLVDTNGDPVTDADDIRGVTVYQTDWGTYFSIVAIDEGSEQWIDASEQVTEEDWVILDVSNAGKVKPNGTTGSTTNPSSGFVGIVVDEGTASAGAGVALIEIVAWNKASSGGSTDSDAIHDNVAGEIDAISEKTSPVSADLILIEDSADSNNKKKVQIDNLPGGAAATPEIDHWTTSETITNDYNNRYVILSHDVPQTGNLSNGLDAGFSSYFLNINQGDWVFTGNSLRDLYDNDLTGYVLHQGQIANFTLESGDNWRVIGDDGSDWNHTSGTTLWNRDVELSDNLASVSGLIGGGGETGYATGIFDSDTLLYRHSANHFKTDGDLTVSGSIRPQYVNMYGASIHRVRNNSSLNIYGGTSDGANLELYGGTHATQADNAFLDSEEFAIRNQAGSSTYATFGPTALTLGTDVVLSGSWNQTVWIPASAMLEVTTNGAAPGSFETTTNDVMIDTMDFDTATEEYSQFSIQMPLSWKHSTNNVNAKFVWSHPATTTNFGVVWGIAGVALSNNNALDTAWGTAVDISDVGGTTDYKYITSWTTNMTIAGTPAEEDTVHFRIRRNVGHGSDTMAEDARLHGVALLLEMRSNTDS